MIKLPASNEIMKIIRNYHSDFKRAETYGDIVNSHPYFGLASKTFLKVLHRHIMIFKRFQPGQHKLCQLQQIGAHEQRNIEVK